MEASPVMANFTSIPFTMASAVPPKLQVTTSPGLTVLLLQVIASLPVNALT